MDFKYITYEKRGRVAILTVNRPDRLNAVGMEVSEEKNRATEDFNADDTLRALIVTGAGRAFSSGADLKEMDERATRGEKDLLPNSKVVAAKTTIAAVNGLAFGGGFETALACDLRICSTAARFCLSEIKRGFVPGSGCYMLQRIIAPGLALHYQLTGAEIDAQEAYRIGLVSKVVEPDQLLTEAIALGEQIADNAPLAVKIQTQIWRDGAYLPLDRAAGYAKAMVAVTLRSDDAKEGARAFVEKRKPVWTGK